MIERKKLYKKGQLWQLELHLWGGASQSVLADSNPIGDTSVQHVSTVTQTVTADSQAEASQTNYNQSDHGNYACLDSAKLNDQAQLTVSGWHATNAAQDRPYHYIIDVVNLLNIWTTYFLIGNILPAKFSMVR